MAFPLTIRTVNSFHQTTSHPFSDEMSHDRTKKPTKLSTLRQTLKQKRTNNKKAKKQNKNKYHKILHIKIKQTRSEPGLVVNFSNIILTDSQINVLNKGLKFIPTLKSDTIHTGVKSFSEFKRQMLPKYHFGAWQDKTVPIFRVKSDWEPTEYIFPPLQKDFPHVPKDITDLYQQPTTNKVNLSQDEIKVLRELKQMKDVVIKSADKGGPILKNTGTYNRKTITTKPLAETTNSCSETKQEFT